MVMPRLRMFTLRHSSASLRSPCDLEGTALRAAKLDVHRARIQGPPGAWMWGTSTRLADGLHESICLRRGYMVETRLDALVPRRGIDSNSNRARVRRLRGVVVACRTQDLRQKAGAPG